VRLITARTYDRNVSSVFYIRRFTRICHAVNTATKPIHRRGAEAARAAHNCKDIRSKRIVGILHSQVYKNLPRCQYSTHFTGMAQRQRAGLITPRSLDQNQLPVFYIRRFTRTYHAVYTATPSLLFDVKLCNQPTNHTLLPV